MDVSKFITSKSEYTLEEIAIEVGLRALGCRCFVGEPFTEDIIKFHIKNGKFNHNPECCRSTSTKDEAIQAALPFGASYCGTPYEIIKGPEVKWELSTGGYCPISGIEKNWTLTNPMLSSSSSSKAQSSAQPSKVAGACVCDFHEVLLKEGCQCGGV